MVPELCTKWAERASVLRRHLTFLVMDKDVLSADDSMGAAVLCLSEAAAKGGAASYRHIRLVVLPNMMELNLALVGAVAISAS